MWWLIWRVNIIALCSCLCLAEQIQLAEYTCQFELDNASFAECYKNHTRSAPITIQLINYEHLSDLNFNSDLHLVKKVAFANLNTFENDLVKSFVYLEKLDIIGDPIYNNNINSLPDLQCLQLLNELNVYNNNLGHTWNSSMSHLLDEHRLLPSSITDLHLVANKITYLPLWIGELVNLKFIDLNYNELEYIPAVLKGLTRLKYLHLNLNYIVNLNTLNSMPSLVYLDVKLQNSQRMIVENYAFDKRNNEQSEEYLIDLIPRFPDQLTFENLALCSTLETKNASRRLLLSNNSLNNCILKQFQGLIDIYYFDSANYDSKMLIKSLDFRECQHKNASHEEHCISIKNCTQLYECHLSSLTLSTKKQNLTTTLSSQKTSKIYKTVVANGTHLKNNFYKKQYQLGYVLTAFTLIRLFVNYF